MLNRSFYVNGAPLITSLMRKARRSCSFSTLTVGDTRAFIMWWAEDAHVRFTYVSIMLYSLSDNEFRNCSRGIASPPTWYSRHLIWISSVHCEYNVAIYIFIFLFRYLYMYLVTWLRMLNVKTWTNFPKWFHRLLHVIDNMCSRVFICLAFIFIYIYLQFTL